jgi:hypothetical protein
MEIKLMEHNAINMKTAKVWSAIIIYVEFVDRE